MSLTNEDLLAISQLLDTKLDSRLKPIENDIKFIRDEQVLMIDEQRRLRGEQALTRDALKHLSDEQALTKKELKRLSDEQSLMKEDQRLFRKEQLLMMKEQTRLRLILENDILRTNNILVENYLPAAKRYENATEKIDAMQTDIDIMKKVLADHSEKLQKIS